MRSRRQLLRLLALGLGLALVGAAEIAARTAPWATPTRAEWNRERGAIGIEHYYTYYPAFFSRTADDPSLCEPDPEMVRSDRSDENLMQPGRFRCEKPDGAFRIVTLGGSSVQGWGVEAGEDFSSQLEALLQERVGSHVEVVNAGVGGYNTLQVQRMVEGLGWLGADLFLLYAGHNDYTYFRVADAAELTPVWRRRAAAWGERSALLRGLRAIYWRARPPEIIQQGGGLGTTQGTGDQMRERDPVWQRRAVPAAAAERSAEREAEARARALIEARYVENVQAIGAAAEAFGAALVVATPVSQIRAPPSDSLHHRGISDADAAQFDALFDASLQARALGGDVATPLDAALSIDDTYSHARYAAGLEALGAGEDAAAIAHLRAAADQIPADGCDRAPPRHAATTRAAADAAGATFIDLWPAIDAAARRPGLPGDRMFMDAVHPTRRGHAALAEALAEALIREGRVR